MPSFPFNLTKKHSYEVDTDSLILSQQRHDQGGVPQEDISETGQHMLLAHQLGVHEEKYSVANKPQPFWTPKTEIIYTIHKYTTQLQDDTGGVILFMVSSNSLKGVWKGYHLHTGIHVLIQRVVHELRFLIPCVYTALYWFTVGKSLLSLLAHLSLTS